MKTFESTLINRIDVKRAKEIATLLKKELANPDEVFNIKVKQWKKPRGKNYAGIQIDISPSSKKWWLLITTMSESPEASCMLKQTTKNCPGSFCYETVLVQENDLKKEIEIFKILISKTKT